MPGTDPLNPNTWAQAAKDVSRNVKKMFASDEDSTAKRLERLASAEDLKEMLNLNDSDTFGIKGHYRSRELVKVPSLKNYTDLLVTPMSTSRTTLGPDATSSVQWDTDKSLLQYFANKVGAIAKDVNTVFTDVAKQFNRENTFKICFGAPFSYLEAVDPFGRVYKDTYGIRKEETWNGFGTASLIYDNSDSKTYMAYIRVGMITQAKGRGLLDKVTANVKAQSQLSDSKQMKELNKQIEEKKNSKEGDGSIIFGLGGKSKEDVEKDRKDAVELEKQKAAIVGQKVKEVNGNAQNASIVTSFSLSYFINENTLTDHKGDAWKKGSVVPFNKYMSNMLRRMIALHMNSGKIANTTYDVQKSSLMSTIRNTFESNDFPFFKFICGAESIVEDSMSNDIGDSTIKGLIDKGSDLGREISFITGYGDAVTALKGIKESIQDSLQGVGDGVIKSMISGVADLATGLMDSGKDWASNIFGEDMVNMILKGNSLIYPQVWKSSRIERQLNITTRFYSPYGDFESIFKHVLLPIFTILGFSLPRQVYPSFISFPFVINVQIPGLMQSNMAIVQTMTLHRGGRYDAWTDVSTMRGADITLIIRPLKPLYGFPEEYKGRADTAAFTFADIDNTIYGDSSRKGDSTFSNEILNMSGSFTITDQDITDQAANLAKSLPGRAGSYISEALGFSRAKTAISDKREQIFSDLLKVNNTK